MGSGDDGPVRKAATRDVPAKENGDTARVEEKDKGSAAADGDDDDDGAGSVEGDGGRAARAGGNGGAALVEEPRGTHDGEDPLVSRENAPLDAVEDFPGEPPREGITGLGPAPGTALAAKYEAGRILAKMDPEGDFDPRLAFAELKASADGTMANDVYLQKGKKAFDHDERVVSELLEVPAGGQEARAQKALGKILEAEHIVVARPLKAGQVMYGKKTSGGKREAEKAARLLGEADAAARDGREPEAVALYREAWKRMSNSREEINGVVDPDGDGLDFRIEKKVGTDPRKGDTDGDGIGDGKELLQLVTDPLEPVPVGSDRDGDGATDREELKSGTNPLRPEGE